MALGLTPDRTGLLSPADAAAARDCFAGAGVAVFPTETLYGLGGAPRRPAAVSRVLALKGRPEGQPMPLLAADPDTALAALAPGAGDAARDLGRLAEAFWPGPLTVVLPARPGLAPGVVAADGTVGVRVPGLALARQLAELAGGLLVATSANRSGQPPAVTAAGAAAGLAGTVDMVVDGGRTPGGAPSTLVALAGGRPRILRAGAVPEDQVAACLGRALSGSG
jgi:L-threonylcarbamoyladenylate synthase